jgi:hypothetical protein
MRDDAAARFHLVEDARPQLQVDGRQQVHRQDRSVADLGVEQVLHAELDLVLDARLLGVLVRFLDAGRVDIDAEAAGAVDLRGRDDVAPVAATKVHDEIVPSHLGHVEHAVDDLLRGRHVDDVELGLVRLLGLRAGQGAPGDQKGSRQGTRQGVAELLHGRSSFDDETAN